MDYCYKHPHRNNIWIFTQNPNWKDHPLELAFMNEALCLDFTQWEMFQTPLMSACKRGSVRKLYRCITCLKGPQAQLTLWLKPTAFGLFTEILQGLAYGPRKEVCICWGPCLPPGSLPKGKLLCLLQSPHQVGRQAFLPHCVHTFSPNPTLRAKYWGKTHIWCYTPAFFLFLGTSTAQEMGTGRPLWGTYHGVVCIINPLWFASRIKSTNVRPSAHTV